MKLAMHSVPLGCNLWSHSQKTSRYSKQRS